MLIPLKTGFILQSRQLTYLRQLTEEYKLFIKSMYKLELYSNNENTIQFKGCTFKDPLVEQPFLKINNKDICLLGQFCIIDTHVSVLFPVEILSLCYLSTFSFQIRSEKIQRQQYP